MSNQLKWLVFGGLGLALTGAGLSFAIEAAFIKHSHEGYSWVWLGTGALIVFNTGLALIGEANHARIKHYLEKREQ
ncbi:MAG: hypothetical protein HRT61_04630 [Ekhidna sp.]|nr:hypothetical protein [Ekhidna sp.]